MRIIVGI